MATISKERYFSRKPMETYFDHYVLGGGWATLVLLPASLLMLAATVRAWLPLTRSRLTGPYETSTEQRVTRRLHELHARHGTVSAEDVRAEVDEEALRLFAMQQPLTAVALLSPMVGLLGSLTSLQSVFLGGTRRLAPEYLASSIERALIPSCWGVAVGALGLAAGLVLRARLYHMERRVIRPAAESAAADLLRVTGAGFGRRRAPERGHSADDDPESAD